MSLAKAKLVVDILAKRCMLVVQYSTQDEQIDGKHEYMAPEWMPRMYVTGNFAVPTAVLMTDCDHSTNFGVVDVQTTCLARLKPDHTFIPECSPLSCIYAILVWQCMNPV